MKNDKELLTTTEVAKELHITTTTVVQWCKKGMIKYIRTLGGHRRITASEMNRVKELEIALGEK